MSSQNEMYRFSTLNLHLKKVKRIFPYPLSFTHQSHTLQFKKKKQSIEKNLYLKKAITIVTFINIIITEF